MLGGPILAVLILGIAFRASDSTYIPPVLPEVSDSVELWQLFHEGLPEYIKEIASSLLPIVVMFGVFQAVALRLDKRTLGRIAWVLPIPMWGWCCSSPVRTSALCRRATIWGRC